MLFEPGPGNEPTDSSSNNNDVVSVSVVDGDRSPPGEMVGIGEDGQTREEEQAQGEREEVVEKKGKTGEHDSREEEESDNFIKL